MAEPLPTSHEKNADDHARMRRWEAECAGLPPMTPGEIQIVAAALRRIEAERSAERDP